MKRYSLTIVSILSISALLALAGCGTSTPSMTGGGTSGGGTPGGGTTGGGTTTQLTMSTLTNGYVLNTTAHKGLEVFNISNGAAVGAGTALPAGSFPSSPTASAVSTAAGFDLALSDGKTVSYNTSSTATDVTKGTVVTNGGTELDGLVTGGTSLQDVDTTLTSGAKSTLTYSTYGFWSEKDSQGHVASVGAFATGVPTTTAQMPTTGTASYTGNVMGAALTPTTVVNIKSGAVALNANFASNTITGSITNIATTAINGGGTSTGTLNDINLSAGTITGTSFSGTAAAAAATASTAVNVAGATGTFGGNFYGPNAAEAAGSFAISGTGTNVFGSFGAHK